MDTNTPSPDAQKGSGPAVSRRRLLGTAGTVLVAGAVVPGVLVGSRALAAASSPTSGIAGSSPASGVAGSSPASGVGAAAVPPGDHSEALRALGRDKLRIPGSLPFPHLSPGTDTLPGIDNIVVLMLENHSYDNYFGMLRRGDGFDRDRFGVPTATNPYPDGRIQHAFHMPTTCQLPSTPSQEWTASHNAFNGGANDGFVRTTISPFTTQIVGGVAMGYWTGDDLPFTYSLATAFPIADRWFSSTMCQTFPNRRYLIAATSLGMTNDIFNPTDPHQLVPPAGTLFNLLDAHGISWANYATIFPNGATPELFPINDAATEAAHHRPFAQFFADAAAGTLPSFSLLDPNYGTQSQENPQNIVVGEGVLAQVVTALGASPQWQNTLFVLVYDEHGGYYDHVPPPAAIPPDTIAPIVLPGELPYDGFARYGFRVPAVVASPYAKRHHVSHVLHDHTSILAMIERKWNLPALTFRDANANDLVDMLDLDALAAREPTFPVLPPLAAPGNTPAALACSVNGPGTIPPPGSITG
jgi:phospholipase C